MKWLTKLFKRKTPDVLLKEQDGQLSLHRSFYIGKRRFVERNGILLLLKEDGRVEGRAWAESWEGV